MDVTSLRWAAVALAVNGIGFGACCLPGIRSLARGGDIPTIMGFPAYGGGPFERIGIQTTVPLLVGFLVVCLLEALAATLVWNASRLGAILALAVVVPGAVYWWGFALPFGPVFAVAHVALLVSGWSALRPA